MMQEMMQLQQQEQEMTYFHSPSGQDSHDILFWDHNRAYVVPNNKTPHSPSKCNGKGCRTHPLIRPEHIKLYQAEERGVLWGNYWWHEEQIRLAGESDAEKAARLAAENKFSEDLEKGSKAYKIQMVQETQAIRHAKKGKLVEPCKKLYSCNGGGDAGGVARPTTKHVSSECWRYEYTDPMTGQYKKVHTCNWLHPGEDGWYEEWNTDRTWKAPKQENRFETAAITDGFKLVKRGRS